MLGFGKRVGQVVGQVCCKKRSFRQERNEMKAKTSFLGETSFLFILLFSVSLFPFFPISFSLFLFLLSLYLSTSPVFLSLLLSLSFSHATMLPTPFKHRFSRTRHHEFRTRYHEYYLNSACDLICNARRQAVTPQYTQSCSRRCGLARTGLLHQSM